MKKAGLFIVAIYCCLNFLQAQYRYSYIKVGVSAGTTNYLGDLDDDLTFKFTRPGLGATACFKFSPRMEGRVHFFQGWIGGRDAVSANVPRNDRNLSFRSPITEGSATLVFDMFPEVRGYRFRPGFNPYIFGGVGVFKFNPQTKYLGQWYDLQPLGTEGQYLPQLPGKSYPKPYALTQICIPGGVGMHIMVNSHWNIDVEVGFRKLFTDYLDDVSGRYPDLDALRAQNPIAADLSYRGPSDLRDKYIRHIRGDRKQADWYVYTGATASYIIDWVRCPNFGKDMRKKYKSWYQ